MKKKSILISSIFLFCLTFQLFAEDSPIQNYKYRHGLYGSIELTYSLDGTHKKKKIIDSIEDVYHETDGWAYIKGYGKIHFWLYDTYKDAEGTDSSLFVALSEWVEKMGYVIDYDQVRKISPDQDTPSSVKSLMKQRGYDVAVALITSDTSYPYGKSPYLVLHNYDKSKDNYWTYIFPLY